MSEYDELPEIFDPSAQEGTSALPPIPIGWYLAQIIEASVEYTQNGNGMYLRTIFEILQGEYCGRKIFENVTLQNANQQAVVIGTRLLTDIYKAVGVTTPTKAIDVLLHKPVKVRVGIQADKTGIYPDRNRVTAVRPPDYEPRQRGLNNRPNGPSPVPAAAAAKPAASDATTSSAAPKPATSTTAPHGQAPWRQ